MILLVAAGEDRLIVYGELPPAFFKQARKKIFAQDMTVSKLSELIGGMKREKIVNWKYVARTKGISILPNLTLENPDALPLGLSGAVLRIKN